MPCSGVLGAAFGVLNGMGMILGGANNAISPSSDVQIFAAVGGITGLLGSPALMLVTTACRALRGVAVVGLVTGLGALLSGIADTTLDMQGASTLVTIAVYIAACIAFRALIGTAAWVEVPGLCVQCGYDLRGLGAPACPECGMARERSRWSDASL